MGLPNITHLQFLLLSILSGSEMSGREIRERLSREDVRTSPPAFYQLMARLEEQRLVEGWYVSKDIDGQKVRERRYKLIGAGQCALREAVRFYNSRAASKLSPATEGGM